MERFSLIKHLEQVLDIMSQCSRYKDMKLSGIQRIIIPPLKLGQYKEYNDNEVKDCFVSWGLLSDNISEKYKQNQHKIQVEDWNSGNNFWIINLLCPHGGAKTVLRRLDVIRKKTGLPKTVNFKRIGSIKGTNRVGHVKRI